MDYSQLSVSDGTGEAVIANIENDRSIASTTLDVDTVENFPAKFIAAAGTKDANNFIDPDTLTIFYGHTDSGDIIIDGYAPGYSDVGNTAGQIVIIKPNTFWADEIVNLAKVSHEDDGTLNAAALGQIYPVGSIYINATNATNPGTLLGFGTWVAFGAGRVPVGLNSGDADFDTAEETGGAKTNNLAHTHTATTGGMTALAPGVAMQDGATDINHAHTLTTSSNLSATTNNLQPYIVVYMWKRTA